MGTTGKLVFYIVFHDWSDKERRGFFINFMRFSERLIVDKSSIFHHSVIVFSMKADNSGESFFSDPWAYFAGVELYLRKRFLASGIKSWEEFGGELKVSLENERMVRAFDHEWIFPETLKVEFSHRINEIL